MNKLVIYGVSDEINSGLRFMRVKMNIHRFDDLIPVDNLEFKFDLRPNSVSSVETLDLYTYLNQRSLGVYEHFILFYLYDLSNDHEVIATNFLFPGNFENLIDVKDPNVRLRFSSSKCEKNKQTINVEIKIEFPAVFLWINVEHEKIKKFKLSQNGFIQVEPVQNVQLTFENLNCEVNLKAEDLIVKTLNKFMM
jgi:hypothetical protein